MNKLAVIGAKGIDLGVLAGGVALMFPVVAKFIDIHPGFVED